MTLIGGLLPRFTKQYFSTQWYSKMYGKEPRHNDTPVITNTWLPVTWSFVKYMSSHCLFLSSIWYHDHFSWLKSLRDNVTKSAYSKATRGACRNRPAKRFQWSVVSPKNWRSSSCGQLAPKEISKLHFISTLFIGWFHLHYLYKKKVQEYLNNCEAY